MNFLVFDDLEPEFDISPDADGTEPNSHSHYSHLGTCIDNLIKLETAIEKEKHDIQYFTPDDPIVGLDTTVETAENKVKEDDVDDEEDEEEEDDDDDGDGDGEDDNTSGDNLEELESDEEEVEEEEEEEMGDEVAEAERSEGFRSEASSVVDALDELEDSTEMEEIPSARV